MGIGGHPVGRLAHGTYAGIVGHTSSFTRPSPPLPPATTARVRPAVQLRVDFLADFGIRIQPQGHFDRSARVVGGHVHASLHCVSDRRPQGVGALPTIGNQNLTTDVGDADP